jgi:hypothetical protein
MVEGAVPGVVDGVVAGVVLGIVVVVVVAGAVDAGAAIAALVPVSASVSIALQKVGIFFMARLLIQEQTSAGPRRSGNSVNAAKSPQTALLRSRSTRGDVRKFIANTIVNSSEFTLVLPLRRAVLKCFPQIEGFQHA